MKEDDHAADDFVDIGVIGVCEVIRRRVAYGRQSEFEAILDE